MTDSNAYEPEVMIPIGDVAKILGVTVATVRNWERAGKISSTRTPGGQRRFRRTDVDELTGATS